MKTLRGMILAGSIAIGLGLPIIAHAKQWTYRFNNGDGRYPQTIEIIIKERPHGYEVGGVWERGGGHRCSIHGQYWRTTGRLRAIADCVEYGLTTPTHVDGLRVAEGKLQLTEPWAATATVEADQPQQQPAQPGRRVTFIRVDSLTKVTNTHQGELTIDAAGQSAHFVNRHDGAVWKTEYTWETPPILVAGETAEVRIGAFITEVRPRQPMSDSINVLAPDLAKQVIANYPDQADKSETYPLPISAGYRNQDELHITVGFMSSTVVYTYRRR